MTTAYLRSDLWAKQCIYQAEAHTKNPQALVHVFARVHFVHAVVIGAITTVIYALATAILLTPHVLASFGSRYLDLCLCRKIRLAFYLAEGRLEGSAATTAVALFSLIWTGCSNWVKEVLNARLDANWAAYKHNLAYQIRQSVADCKAQRLASVTPDEVYCPYGAGSQPYLVILADELEKRMLDHCNAFSLGTVTEGKFERYETALNEIDRFVSARSDDLWKLPLTLADIGPWRMRGMAKLKSRALGFLTKQADRVAAREQRRHATKFDSTAFYQNVAEFSQEIKTDLETQIENMKLQQELLTEKWKAEVTIYSKEQKKLRAQVLSLQKTAAKAEWWADRFSFMPQFILDYLTDRATDAHAQAQAVGSQLAGINGVRAAAVQAIANGIFLDFHNNVFHYEHTFNGLVDANGRILKKVAYLARPVWYTRIWRTVSPTFSWLPSVQKRLEDLFDPDL